MVLTPFVSLHVGLGVGWRGRLLGRGLDSLSLPLSPFVWGWCVAAFLRSAMVFTPFESLCLPSCGRVLVGDFARKKRYFTRLALQVANVMRASCFFQGKIACKAGAKRALCFSNDFARKKLTWKTTGYTRAGSEILNLCFCAVRKRSFCFIVMFMNLTKSHVSI